VFAGAPSPSPRSLTFLHGPVASISAGRWVAAQQHRVLSQPHISNRKNRATQPRGLRGSGGLGAARRDVADDGRPLAVGVDFFTALLKEAADRTGEGRDHGDRVGLHKNVKDSSADRQRIRDRRRDCQQLSRRPEGGASDCLEFCLLSVALARKRGNGTEHVDTNRRHDDVTRWSRSRRCVGVAARRTSRSSRPADPSARSTGQWLRPRRTSTRSHAMLRVVGFDASSAATVVAQSVARRLDQP
jgi:hypothetical protein